MSNCGTELVEKLVGSNSSLAQLMVRCDCESAPLGPCPRLYKMPVERKLAEKCRELSMGGLCKVSLLFGQKC